jgi:hypothetical protein
VASRLTFAGIDSETDTQAAELFEWKAPHLIIHCKGFDKPLRFTRMGGEKPTRKDSAK